MNLLVGSGKDVIGSILLVGGDEVGVVNRGKRDEVLHQRSDLSLEIELEDLGSGHGLIERHGRDIPSSKDEVVGVTEARKGEDERQCRGRTRTSRKRRSEGKFNSHHGKNIREGNVDVLSSGIDSESEGRSSNEL